MARSWDDGRVTFNDSARANAATLATLLVCLFPGCAFHAFRFFIFQVFVGLLRSALSFLRFRISGVVRSTLDRDRILLRWVGVGVYIQLRQVRCVEV